eukprot:TRINITY_DN8247_c0_g1_i3.p1 TRINITY_DN8247_c0_g1~~TRINITY_DN8247_c0_g1_i3.p1  ORF type:complete len:317 (-),score=94.40 TRINITY_DN8247_c0_g1_i3:225-1175(-)
MPGLDKHGRVLVFTRADAWDAETLLGLVPLHRFVRYVVWFMEGVAALLGEVTEHSGTHSETMSLLVEWGGGVSLSKKMRQLMHGMVQALSAHYPERLGAVLVIHAPSLMALFWGFFKGMLTEKTQAKIQITGADYQAALDALGDASVLPCCCGGAVPVLPSGNHAHLAWHPADPVPAELFPGLAPKEQPPPTCAAPPEATAAAAAPRGWGGARAVAKAAPVCKEMLVHVGTHGQDWIQLCAPRPPVQEPAIARVTPTKAKGLKELMEARRMRAAQQQQQPQRAVCSPGRSAAQQVCVRVNAELQSKQQLLLNLRCT